MQLEPTQEGSSNLTRIEFATYPGMQLTPYTGMQLQPTQEWSCNLPRNADVTYPGMQLKTYPGMQVQPTRECSCNLPRNAVKNLPRNAGATYPGMQLKPTQECSLKPTQECGGWDDACSLGHHDGDARLQEGDGEVHVLLPLPTDLQHQKGYYHIRKYKYTVNTN